MYARVMKPKVRPHHSALILLALLGSCNLFPQGNDTPSVKSVTPANGSPDVGVTSTISAQLELGGEALNLTTLTPETVPLTGPAGPVEANRSYRDGAITVTPAAPLAAATPYTFSITSGLKTESGRAMEPYSSTFTTGAGDPTSPEDPTAPEDPSNPDDPSNPVDPTDPTDPGAGIDGLSLRNASGAPSSNRMVLSRIGEVGNPCEGKDDPKCNPERWDNLKTTDTGTVIIKNNGSEALELAFSTSSPDTFTVSPASASLQAGESEQVEVTFSGNFSKKVMYEGFFHTDVNGQRASLELVGNYMDRPEGGAEPSLPQILKAFGYEVTLGDFRSNSPGTPAAGLEVRSRLWQKADPSKPIRVTTLAALKTCCFASDERNADLEFFEPEVTNGVDYVFRLPYDPDYAQSLYPASPEGDTPAVGETDFSGPFRIQVDRYSSRDIDESGLVGIRVWPVNNKADSFIVGQDYAVSDCSEMADPEEENPIVANCDFQDHVHLVENIMPVESPVETAPVP